VRVIDPPPAAIHHPNRSRTLGLHSERGTVLPRPGGRTLSRPRVRTCSSTSSRSSRSHEIPAPMGCRFGLHLLRGAGDTVQQNVLGCHLGRGGACPQEVLTSTPGGPSERSDFRFATLRAAGAPQVSRSTFSGWRTDCGQAMSTDGRSWSRTSRPRSRNGTHERPAFKVSIRGAASARKSAFPRPRTRGDSRAREESCRPFMPCSARSNHYGTTRGDNKDSCRMKGLLDFHDIDEAAAGGIFPGTLSSARAAGASLAVGASRSTVRNRRATSPPGRVPRRHQGLGAGSRSVAKLLSRSDQFVTVGTGETVRERASNRRHCSAVAYSVSVKHPTPISSEPSATSSETSRFRTCGSRNRQNPGAGATYRSRRAGPLYERLRAEHRNGRRPARSSPRRRRSRCPPAPGHCNLAVSTQVSPAGLAAPWATAAR